MSHNSHDAKSLTQTPDPVSHLPPWRRAVATATAQQAPELVGLQRDEWPDFVAFFRGASAYVQVWVRVTLI